VAIRLSSVTRASVSVMQARPAHLSLLVELAAHAQQQGPRRRFFSLDNGQRFEVVEQGHRTPPWWVGGVGQPVERLA
jgi:hypothetical protein